MIILPVLFALASAKAPLPVPAYLAEVSAEWKDTFGLDVQVRSKHCGSENAFYTFATKEVTMCDELFGQPLLARWVLAHELGHALMDKFDIPWVAAEDAADELAMLMATEDESYAAARWFMLEVGGEDGEHSSGLDRAGAILCYLDGSSAHPESRQCKMYAKSITAGWVRTMLPLLQ